MRRSPVSIVSTVDSTATTLPTVSLPALDAAACDTCNAQLMPDARFCTSCGAVANPAGAGSTASVREFLERRNHVRRVP